MVKTKRPTKSLKNETVGGFNISPLISALLLAVIKLSISQNGKKLGEPQKVSRSKSNSKRK